MMKARAVKLHSALGDGALLFRRMTAHDALGRPFRYDLELLSEDDHIVLEDVLGSAMTVELELVDGASRHFSGHVSHLRFAGIEGNYAKYRATLRPWLWLLTRTHDCRIFQEKSVPEIIKAIFGKYDAAAFDDRMSESYSPREYCVQYRESDFNFVSRLMEDEGIYYYFAHERDRHTLVLADSYVAHDAAPGYETVPYFPPDDLARRDRDHLHDWEVALGVQPGAYALTSFDFTKPGADLMAQLHQPKGHAEAEGEIYDYPGPHCELDHGQRAARIRLEARQARHKRVQGGGPVAGLGPGHLFTLAGYPRDDQNIEYLVTQTVHEVRSDAYRSSNGAAGEDEEICVVRLAAIPAAQPYRSPSVTPRPVVRGPQTAIVTGKAGEEIWTDQYGRVKVQFHWDREGKRDENSSCWVRVSQLWAGSGFGGIHIPRIGQEVVIDFFEGNPDHPFVSGRVYNAAVVVPYDLPGSATQSGVKSNSTKGGGGSNELRFEDKKGEEEVYLHAQKNETIVVENDKSETVKHDETIAIGNDRTETVGRNETLSVGVDRTRSVGNNEVVSIGQNRADTVGANETRTVALIQAQNVGLHRNVAVGANETKEVGANRVTLVGRNVTARIGNNRSANVGDNDSLSVGKDRSEQVGKNRTTSVGENDALSVGKKLSITAGDEITITTGKASIVMKKDGTIVIKGKDITIDGSGKINAKASKTITMKGDKILQN